MGKSNNSWTIQAKQALYAYQERERRLKRPGGKDTMGPREREEIAAVRRTLARVSAQEEGREKKRFLQLVYIGRSRTLQGAAMELYISERTAKRWNREAIGILAEELGYKLAHTDAAETGK